MIPILAPILPLVLLGVFLGRLKFLGPEFSGDLNKLGDKIVGIAAAALIKTLLVPAIVFFRHRNSASRAPIFGSPWFCRPARLRPRRL